MQQTQKLIGYDNVHGNGAMEVGWGHGGGDGGGQKGDY